MLRAFLKQLGQSHSKRGWSSVIAIFGLIILAVPLLHIFPPEDSFFHVPEYMVALLGKFLCFAMVAIAMDLIWGFTGILSLGHGVFFAMGGYCMGMYLMRSIGTDGVYRNELPDFMVFLDWKELPWFWYGFDSFGFALIMALFVPGLLAFIFGFFAFRSRIKGVYFSIITQAITYAAMLFFFRNDTGFGGNNGLTDFKRILGFSLHETSTKVTLYVASAIALTLTYIVAKYIVSSKLGRILRAIRDAEGRVMFSGYQPQQFKLFIWTLSGIICGLAGALYVPQVGIINPSEMHPANSIEIAIWAAVGGRGTLLGPILGAFVVNGAKSWFTVAYPDLWLYVLGTLFILVTLFLPQGLIGLKNTLKSGLRRLKRRKPEPELEPDSAETLPDSTGVNV